MRSPWVFLTHITPKVLANANRLIAVGAFCIGTNQIDLTGCLKKGVVVFNAPYSNTRSVVELAIGEIIFLLRNIPDKIRNMNLGLWTKSSENSVEIRGKNRETGRICVAGSILPRNLNRDVKGVKPEVRRETIVVTHV